MSRIRSPAYPNVSLSEAIEYARKIHKEDRQHPVAREVAAQHMGFSGATGSSDRAISALFHFGLAEKVIKGEIRVTGLAMRLLHPDDDREFRTALHEAGFRPALFQELRSRYPDAPPSISSLASYLTRQNFAAAAITPAAKAYLETCAFLQRENAYESEDTEGEFEAASPQAQRREETQPMSTLLLPIAPVAPPPPALVAPTPTTDLELNEPSLIIRGNTVRIEALLDFEGLSELEGKIQALKMLMKPSGKSRAVVLSESQEAAVEQARGWSRENDPS